MLAVDPLLVFVFDEMHQTSLIWAVKRRNYEMAYLLLRHFSRVNFQDITGRTALNFAVALDDVEMVKLLLCF